MVQNKFFNSLETRSRNLVCCISSNTWSFDCEWLGKLGCGQIFWLWIYPSVRKNCPLEPGFGLANTMGFVAFLWISILALTSSDRAMRWLGASSWKWMHTGSNIVFYLVAIHTSYFLFIHYTESFHKSVPPQSTFVIPFVVMSIVVLVLQISSYIKVVKSKNKKITQK